MQGRAGELQLPGRLQGDVGHALGQRDRRLAFTGDVPPETRGQRLEQLADTRTVTVEGRRGQVIRIEPEFLVLGPDAPFITRLLARGEVGDQIVTVADRRALGGAGYGHGLSLDEGAAVTGCRTHGGACLPGKG